MKKLCVLCVVVSMLLTMVACSNTKDQKKDKTNTDSPTNQEATTGKKKTNTDEKKQRVLNLSTFD